MTTAAQRRHMGEINPVSGFEGFYEVSSDGRVFSISRTLIGPNGVKRFWLGREMKPKLEKNGYLRVQLSKFGKKKYISVHRIVCESFHGKSNVGMQVNHKNCVKRDNRSCNLEWVTSSQNQLHSYAVLNRLNPRNMLGKFGAKHNRSISIEAFELKNGIVVATFGSMHEAGRCGYSPTRICACTKGKSVSHKGLGWRVSGG